MKNLIILALLAILLMPAKAQLFQKDTSKTNELTKPYIQRPLVNYKNQWNIGVGYDYHIIYNQFNDKGEIRSLARSGQHTYQDSWELWLNYGLFKNAEIGINNSFINRTDYLNKFSYQFEKNDKSYNIQETKQIRTKAWDNTEISLKYMFVFRKFEVAIGIGADFYLFPDKAKSPEITSYSTIINSVSDENFYKEVIVHKNLEHNNKIVAKLESKYPFSKSCIYVAGAYYKGLNSEIEYNWNSVINTNSQEYEQELSKTKFTYGNLIKYELLYKLQIKPVFMAYAGINGKNYFGGSVESTFLPKTEDVSWFQFHGKIGYLLQLSPNLYFEQTVLKCLKGRNSDIPFVVHTSMFFNFF